MLSFAKHPFFAGSIAIGAFTAAFAGGGLHHDAGRVEASRSARKAAKTRAHEVEENGRREASELWWRQRAYPAGRIPAAAYPKALAQFRSLTPTRVGRDKLDWQLVGPGPLDTKTGDEPPNPNWSPAAGRVAAVAVDPSDPKTIYAGSGAGGLWRSNDGGATWKPLTDAQPTNSIASITIDPAAPKTIWVGTGSGDPFAGYYGAGLLKSTDGGDTWERLGAEQFQGVSLSHVILDGSSIYVSTTYGGAGNGDACTNTNVDAPGQGVYRSDDGGATWTELLTGSIVDLEIDTTVTPRRMYVYDYYSGVHRSEDGGATWTEPTGLPDHEDRIELAIAPSNPAIVYAGAGVANVGSLYVSNDFGATFTQVPNVPDYCEAQCFYDDVVTVDPADPGTVWLGGATCSIWKGTGALGASPSFAAVSLPNNDCGANDEHWFDAYVHSDAHAIVYDPHDPKTVYVGTDGGLARTSDSGATWQRLNDGVATIELYAVCADPADPNAFYGGAQDNGTFLRNGSSVVWTGITTGDGSGCAVDPTDGNVALVAIQYGTTFLSTDRYQQDFQYVFDTQKPDCVGLAGCGDRVSFIPPMAAHPREKGTFYIGTSRLWRSKGGGADKTWKAFGKDLTAGEMMAPCVPAGSGMEDDYLSAIGPAPSDTTTIYTGSAAGVISVTRDDGKTWTPIGGAPLPNRYASGIAVDAADPATVVVAFSGFDANTPDTPGHLFRSTNAGKSWQRIELGMDAPVNALASHPTLPGLMYAGLEVGVMVSTDGGQTWAPLGTGLPTAPVWALSFSQGTNTLVAGTHGRSAWKTTFKPALAVDPVQITMTVEEGTKQFQRALTVQNTETLGSVLTAQLTTDAAWILVPSATKPVGGNVSSSLAIFVDPSGKKAGSYDASITVDAGAAGSIAVPVHLVVTKAATPPVDNTPVLVAGGGSGCSQSGRGDAGGAIALIGMAALAMRRRRQR